MFRPLSGLSSLLKLLSHSGLSELLMKLSITANAISSVKLVLITLSLLYF
jgi:hypothetical protein